MNYSEQIITYPAIIMPYKKGDLIQRVSSKYWRYQLSDDVLKNKTFDGAKIIDAAGKFMSIKEAVHLGKSSVFWSLILSGRPNKYDFILENTVRILDTNEIKSLLIEKINSEKAEWNKILDADILIKAIHLENDLKKLYHIVD